MSLSHFSCEEAGGKKTEGDIDALAIQDLKKGMRPEQFLSNPHLQKDGNFDMVVRDAEGNLKHIVASNTDPGAKTIYRLFKAAGGKPLSLKIGQHIYKVIGMDDGLSATPAQGSA